MQASSDEGGKLLLRLHVVVLLEENQSKALLERAPCLQS